MDREVLGGKRLSGAATGLPLIILRLEALSVLCLGAYLYATFGIGWTWFAVFFLTPDLSLLGYLFGRKIGAVIYNAGHSYVGPVACGCAGLLSEHRMLLSVATIWACHIAFDRVVGFGLKYFDGPGFTHLGVMGRASAQ